MLHRSKSAIVAATALAALVPSGGPANAADVAMAACQVTPLFSVIEYRQTVLIWGVYHAPAGAVDVKLTCGVQRNGSTYARATDTMVGPAAAVAATATVPAGSVYSCQEITVTYLDGHTTYSDSCP